MVKVYGPMMSLDASGTLGKAVTFSKWKGRNYVRERVIPANPKSGGQVGRRAMFKFLSQEWHDLLGSAKATWQDLADQLIALKFNAYISANMKRWHNFIGPSQRADPTETNTPSDDTLAICTWEENRILMASQITTVNQAWGTAIFADETPGFTPSVGNCIMLVDHDSVDTFDEYWTPPKVSAWSFNMRPFTADGVLGAATGETTAAAP